MTDKTKHHLLLVFISNNHCIDFRLHYENYVAEKQKTTYYQLSNTPALVDFLKFLTNEGYIKEFDYNSIENYWLKIDNKKCKLIKNIRTKEQPIVEEKEFEAVNVFDWFDEDYSK